MVGGRLHARVLRPAVRADPQVGGRHRRAAARAARAGDGCSPGQLGARRGRGGVGVDARRPLLPGRRRRRREPARAAPRNCNGAGGAAGRGAGGIGGRGRGRRTLARRQGRGRAAARRRERVSRAARSCRGRPGATLSSFEYPYSIRLPRQRPLAARPFAAPLRPLRRPPPTRVPSSCRPRPLRPSPSPKPWPPPNIPLRPSLPPKWHQMV
jgi:hypothetical protein